MSENTQRYTFEGDGDTVQIRGMGTRTATVKFSKGRLTRSDTEKCAKAFNLNWQSMRSKFRTLQTLQEALVTASSFGADVSTQKARDVVHKNQGLMERTAQLLPSYEEIPHSAFDAFVSFLTANGKVSSTGSLLGRAQDVMTRKGYDVETPLVYSSRDGHTPKATIQIQVPIPVQALFLDDNFTTDTKLGNNALVSALHRCVIEYLNNAAPAQAADIPNDDKGQ